MISIPSILTLMLLSFPVASNSTAWQEPVAAPAPAVLSRFPDRIEYRLLATRQTSTMQKELNEAAAAGFRFAGVMGGETMVGSEVVVVMTKDPTVAAPAAYQYLLLATSKTSTMQKELQEAADAGFAYCGQSIFSSTFVIILERNRDAAVVKYEYLLLATRKTGTMQKELAEAGERGFRYVGVTVAQTGFGGNEVVTILRRPL
ncbi:MAG: hypothetical protein IT175_02620 [Acidobacteria bacterium]|nr:hypothetical protein [Acidobacteriota bacterium]